MTEDIGAKTQIMAFTGGDSTTSKTVMNNKILEQVGHFSYLGYEYDKDIDKNLMKYENTVYVGNKQVPKQQKKEGNMNKPMVQRWCTTMNFLLLFFVSIPFCR